MNDILVIKLNLSDKICVIDAEDMNIVSSYTWWVNNGNAPVVYTSIWTNPIGYSLSLSNLVMGTDYKLDHINRNPFDNRKSNLRFCTNSQNGANRIYKTKRPKSSKYKGVSFHKQHRKFGANIKVMYKAKHLGYFDTEEEAARAYDKAAKYYFGEFAVLNFHNL